MTVVAGARLRIIGTATGDDEIRSETVPCVPCPEIFATLGVVVCIVSCVFAPSTFAVSFAGCCFADGAIGAMWMSSDVKVLLIVGGWLAAGSFVQVAICVAMGDVGEAESIASIAAATVVLNGDAAVADVVATAVAIVVLGGITSHSIACGSLMVWCGLQCG